MLRAQLEPQVLQVPRELLGLQVLLVLQVRRVRRVLLEPLEQRGLQVQLVLQVQPRQARQE